MPSGKSDNVVDQAPAEGIFVGGLHGSGAHLIPGLLDQHTEVESLRLDDEETDGEEPPIAKGELFQTVFEPDGYYGGPGAFAFHPSARADPDGDRYSQADIEQFRTEYHQVWDEPAVTGVQHSPANIVRAKFLAEAFPNSPQLYVHRHPVLDALETRERTDDKNQPMGPLVQHWLRAHEQLLRDIEQLDNCFVVSFHELRRRPNEILGEVLAAAGLEPEPIDATDLRSVGREGWAAWREGPEQKRETVLELEPEIRRFGYSLDEPAPVEEPAVEDIVASPTPVDRLCPEAYDLPSAREEIAADLTAPETPESLLFVSFGTRGDVQPHVALASGFEQRGYDVTICSNEDHRDLVERHDIDFVSPHPAATIEVPVLPEGSDTEQMDGFFNELAAFYEEYGTEVISTVESELSSADCVLTGTAVFFRGLLYNHFEVPTVDVRLAPLYVDGNDGRDSPAVANFFEEIITVSYATVNFKINDALDEAYEACDIDYRYGDEGLVAAMPRMKNTLRLRGYSPRVGDDSVPGVPDATTGFWQLSDTIRTERRGEVAPTASDGGVTERAAGAGGHPAVPADDAALMDESTREFLEDGPAPVCLTFGSASVFGPDGPDWVENLLGALRASDQRVLTIGPDVPGSVREWSHHVDAVPHEAVFPHCRAVIHHGGAGTTATCLRAGTPAVIAPPITWADMPQWAAWVEQEGAGIHVADPATADFAAVLDRIEDDSYAEQAAETADALAAENGVETAIDRFEEQFSGTDIDRAERRETIEYIDSLPVASWRTLTLVGLPLLSEPDAYAGETLKRRDAYLDSMEETAREHPIYKEDWPHKGRPLDLEKHDLPHDSSGTEWWYFHGHLETESGRDLSLFSSLFERDVDGKKLAHVNAGAVDATRDEKFSRAISDPRTPEEVVPELADAPATDYFKRALREVYEKGKSPRPDKLADEPADIPRDEYGYSLGDLHVDKDEEGYTARLDPEDADGAFGFDLRFIPEKGPNLNYKDGVMRGVTNDVSMFYYSFTRMEVTGTVTLDGEQESVSGSGWYDHEFGGGKGTVAALGGFHSWLWKGIQFDDGSELVYTTVTDKETGDRIHDDDIVFIDPDGNRSLHTGNIEQKRTWSSMKTFIEYGVEWELSVPDLDLELHIEGARDNQEIRTVIAGPAYWEGRITVEGERNGEPIIGTGICEQYGQGGNRSHYRTFLDDVSREVQRSVRELLPKEDISDEKLVELVASEDQSGLVEGVDKEAFSDSIVDPIRTIVDRGGKGWRSMCAILCADAVSGEAQKYQPVLAIPELVHSGSLMVDDIQDNSDSRRGGPTIHREFGEAHTINAGTMSYFLGYESMLEEVDVSDDQWLRAYRLHNLMMRAAHAGQGLDIHGLQHKIDECIENDDFDELWENLRAVHVLKSAVPAMIAARMGVVISGGDREIENTIGEYFEALGLAFQMVDDAINLRGFEHDLKQHAEDLLEGKVTAPIVRAFQVLDEPEQRELAELLQQDPEEKDIGRILDLVEGCGAVDWCHEYARDLVEDAWEPVDEALEESQAKMMLRAFSWFVVNVRDY